MGRKFSTWRYRKQISQSVAQTMHSWWKALSLKGEKCGFICAQFSGRLRAIFDNEPYLTWFSIEIYFSHTICFHSNQVASEYFEVVILNIEASFINRNQNVNIICEVIFTTSWTIYMNIFCSLANYIAISMFVPMNHEYHAIVPIYKWNMVLFSLSRTAIYYDPYQHTTSTGPV